MERVVFGAVGLWLSLWLLYYHVAINAHFSQQLGYAFRQFYQDARIARGFRALSLGAAGCSIGFFAAGVMSVLRLSWFRWPARLGILAGIAGALYFARTMADITAQ